MAENAVNINITCADAAALATWMSDLATDITGGKVTGVELVVSSEGVGFTVKGKLVRPNPTDLAVAIENV